MPIVMPPRTSRSRYPRTGVPLITVVLLPLTFGSEHCQPQCNNECAQLNGNLSIECGGCGSSIACRPGAEGFANWQDRRPQKLRRWRQNRTHGHTGTAVGRQTSRPPLRSTRRELCPTDEAATPDTLPVIRRYCRRGMRACASTDRAIAWHLAHVQPPEGRITRPVIIHRERPQVGAGFAHVLQEQSQVLLLGLVLSRPVQFRSEGTVFNQQGALLGPSGALDAVLYGSSARLVAGKSRGWASALFCSAARTSRQPELALPYECVDAGGNDQAGGANAGSAEGAAAEDVGADATIDAVAAATGPGDRATDAERRPRAEWVLALADGDAWSVIRQLKGRWDRFTHATALRPLKDYLPDVPLLFASPSVISMYAADFVEADGAIDATKRNTRASVAELTHGHSDLSGPRCLVRRLVSSAHPSVHALVNAALRPTAPANTSAAGRRVGSLVVGLHVRRGDAAMQAECVDCVNGDDPDVVDKLVRVTLPDLDRELGCVNRTLEVIESAARARFGFAAPAVHVFVASDTLLGMRRATAILGASRVLSVDGTAVHSTRKGLGDEREEPALKVAADFLGLTLADVHLGIGDSSFMGNAAAAGTAAVARISSRTPSGTVCRPIERAELHALLESVAEEVSNVAHRSTPGSSRVEL